MVNLDLPILNRVKNILTKTEKIDTDIASVLTKLAEQGVDIDSIITSIGTSGDQASAATIFGKLAGLASQSGGAIKNVQKMKVNGYSTINDDKYVCNNATYSPYYKDVKISNVNISKTFVICYNPVINYSINKSGGAKLLNSTTVRVFATDHTDNNGKYSGDIIAEIQVIEFY